MAKTIPSGSWIHTLDVSYQPKELRSTISNSKAEFYTIDDFIYTIGGGGSGAAGILSELINVTNPDGAFTHLPSQINAGVSIEVLLRDMLNPYIATTCSVNSLSIKYFQQSSWGANYVVDASSSIVLEYGQKFDIQSVQYSVANADVVQDNSGVFIFINSVNKTSISDTATSFNLTPNLVIDSTSSGPLPPEGRAYNISMTFVDNGSGSDQVISSATRSIKFLDNIAVGTSSSAVVTPSLFSSLSVYNAQTARRDISFTGNSDTDNGSNYTWIAYPYSWGLASDILLAATGVLGDFQPQIIASSLDNNSQSAAVDYIFYRSTSKGAFGVGQNITVKF
tara:strand:+ start:3375 stop:4385 length:1011 start_codon:yes stop_codon:yes gene_type:complete